MDMKYPMDLLDPPAADPDLQRSVRLLRRIATGAVLALALLGAAAGLAGPADAAASGTDPELPVTTLTRHVNEYEGQHRLAAAGDPSQWGLASGKDPDVPVTPTLTRKVNEYEGQHRLGSKDPDVPVSPTLASGKDPEIPVTPTLTRKVNEYEGQH